MVTFACGFISNIRSCITSTLGQPIVRFVAISCLLIFVRQTQSSSTSVQKFYLPENAEEFFTAECDYIIDAIDTVTAKIDLIVRAQSKGVRMISCMGAGNKMDPTQFEVADVFKTSVCPLAKVMRYELKARGIKSQKVVYSREKPLKPQGSADSDCRAHTPRNQIPGSISFVPSVAGLILAGEVIKDLIGYQAD